MKPLGGKMINFLQNIIAVVKSWFWFLLFSSLLSFFFNQGVFKANSESDLAKLLSFISSLVTYLTGSIILQSFGSDIVCYLFVRPFRSQQSLTNHLFFDKSSRFSSIINSEVKDLFLEFHSELI
jgi:hypothetical protein